MLTVPTMRNIRARYRGEMCNTALRLQKGILRPSSRNHRRTVPGRHMVQLGILTVVLVLIITAYKYFGQYTYNFCLFGELDFRASGVLCIENETTIGARQTVQREDIPMLFKESPYLRLFPTPSLSQGFQS